MGLPGLAVVVVCALAAPAAAQQAASEPGAGSGGSGSSGHTAASGSELGSDVVRRESPHKFPHAGIGARLGYGWAYAGGVPDAYLVRLDYEAFLFITPRHTVGGMFGFIYGFDYWHARDGVPDNWGFGMPTAVVIGMRAVVVRGYIGGGLNAITVDQVADDTGFGWCSPMAIANVGLDLFSFNVTFDTRVSRRWQVGSPDITQWMFSIMVGATLEPKHHPRAFGADPQSHAPPGQRR